MAAFLKKWPRRIWHSCYAAVAGKGRKASILGNMQSRSIHLCLPRAFATVERYNFSNVVQDAKSLDPCYQLDRLRSLIADLSVTNSRLEKVEILRKYPDLAQLLHFILYRHTRLHIRPDVLKKRIADRSESTSKISEQGKTNQSSIKKDIQFIHENEESVAPSSDLLTLFSTLKRREITGHDALDFIIDYLDRNAIFREDELTSHAEHSLSLLDVFMRCLNRNLKVGVSGSIIKSAFPEQNAKQAICGTNVNNDRLEHLGEFSLALGKSLEIPELEETIKEGLEAINDENAWFVSRKLDGVRCVLQIDLRIVQEDNCETNNNFRIKPIKITALSRTGKPFRTLDVLTGRLNHIIAQIPLIKDMISSTLRDSRPIGPNNDALDVARIYLDGEVCILRPETVLASDSKSSTEMNEIPFVEDFHAIVGPIKRKNFTIINPAYFPFDILSYDEFQNWRNDSCYHDPFYKRAEKLKRFIKECKENDLSDIIRPLEQEKIASLSDMQRWRGKAAERGWEGLIIRKGGYYEGRRTTSIRKIKDWQEDEYVVEAIETAIMRLPVGQKYAERLAMASAVIRHKGIPVHVGSGFSAEQRLKFAQKPELIIGKMMTVVYFEESRSAHRSDEHQFSLRFPKVKYVWNKEGRNV